MPSITDVCMKVDSLAEPVAALECEIATHALMVLSSLSYNLLEGGADDTTELLPAVRGRIAVFRGMDRAATEMLFLNILQDDWPQDHVEFRLDVIDRIAELGALSARHHQEVVNHECCNQQTAYDRLRELECPTRPLPTTESEAHYDFYFD
eukprot:6720467-Prymnesium_polylepis.1